MTQKCCNSHALTCETTQKHPAIAIQICILGALQSGMSYGGIRGNLARFMG